jgi:hypothetical protein
MQDSHIAIVQTPSTNSIASQHTITQNKQWNIKTRTLKSLITNNRKPAKMARTPGHEKSSADKQLLAGGPVYS